MSENKHVFISYSSKDVEYVNQITEAMERAGIAYWKAPNNIPTGSNYAKEIPKAIRECSLFLLVYSNNAQNSIWVEKELDTAICERKEIFPVRIDDVDFNDLFKFYLNNVQLFNATQKEGTITNVEVIIKKIVELGKFKQVELKSAGVKEKIQVFVDGGSKHRSVDKRSNALRMNKIPLECEFCGGDIELKSIGVYVCEKCGKENYDDFYKVRNYIETYGPAPALVISKYTGVSRASIEYFKSNNI